MARSREAIMRKKRRKQSRIKARKIRETKQGEVNRKRLERGPQEYWDEQDQKEVRL